MVLWGGPQGIRGWSPGYSPPALHPRNSICMLGMVGFYNTVEQVPVPGPLTPPLPTPVPAPPHTHLAPTTPTDVLGAGYLGRWVPRKVGTSRGGYLGRWVPREVGTLGGGYLGRWVPREVGT